MFQGTQMIAAGLVLLSAAGCGRRSEDGWIQASGHVEATEVRISTKVPGTLLELGVDEGDRVTAGQELARIDTTDLRLALDAARAEEKQAAADLQLRLAGARKEDVAEARAQVTRAAADLDGAERDLARMQGLLQSGSGTEKSRDDARTRRDMTAAALDAAKERLRRLEAGSRREEIAAARARADAAKARIAQLEQQIRDATITSPLAGVVTEKLADQGELMAVGTGVVVVTDIGQPWLTVYVSEPDLGKIRLGQKAEVTTDGGERRTGTITYIASEAEFTPKNVQTRDERVKLVYKVKIGLPNADGLFKPGMPSEARLRPAEKAS